MNWGIHIWGIFNRGQLCLPVLLVLFVMTTSSYVTGQVGINTTNPQEKLHIAGTTGTMRVESLNAANNPYNGGDTDNDGNMDNNTVPLYVDENGDFTLELDVLENSGSEDYITPALNNAFTLNASNSTGCEHRLITAYNFPPISRPTLLQVKYNVSHTIKSNGQTSLSDGLARRVDNYIRITPDPDPTDGVSDREYGPSSRAYTSASLNSIQGPFFNGHTTYIKLIPPTNTTVNYTLLLYGRVCSNLNTSGSSLQTTVSFTDDTDFLFLKLH